MKRIVVVLTNAPYGNSSAQDGLDFATAGTNFGHDMVVLFEGDGIWQLSAHQTPAKGTKHVLKRIKALPFFDIEEIYACQQSLQSRMNNDDLPAVTSSITPQAKADLLRAADFVVRF